MPILLLAAALFGRADSLLVSSAWLAAHRAVPDLVVLHVSMEREDYAAGHVPGARWVNPHDFFQSGAPGVELPPAARLDSLVEVLGITQRSRIVCYGDTWMAPRLFIALDYLGLGQRTSLLDGGLSAWKSGGRPLSTEAPTWEKSSFTPSLRLEMIASTSQVRSSLDDPRLRLLDGRSPGEYAGSDHSEQLPRFGHIPGGVNLPWEMTFTDGPAALQGRPSRLQPIGVLRKLFLDAGITDASDLITYCTVGLRASHLYFIARYLGFRPRLYDGSMSEWSRTPELPMVTGGSPR
jgi:thiosulfate/3-mercaptopyruvate sulfurtransferase